MDSGLESGVLKFADDTKIFNGISGVQDCDTLQMGDSLDGALLYGRHV